MTDVGNHSNKTLIDDQIITQFEYDQAHDQLIRNDVLLVIDDRNHQQMYK